MPITDNQNFLIEFMYYTDPNGVQYNLFGGSKALMSWEGAGAPPINYLSDKGPQQHGRTIRDFRYQQRRITVEMYERGCRRADWWTNELALIDALRPNRSSTNQPGYLMVITPDNVEREIPVYLERGPEGDWIGTGPRVPEDLRERLTFLSGDPFWRDPTQNSETFTVNPVTACLPTCLPFCLGGLGLINTSVDIAYTGTWEGDQITIVITGPIEGPIIRNETTDKEIKLNYNIAAGEAVTISINPNIATVTNNSGQNLIGTVEDIADLNDFRLVTAGDLTSDGTNTIFIFGEGGVNGQTSIIFQYYTRDISIFGV